MAGTRSGRQGLHQEAWSGYIAVLAFIIATHYHFPISFKQLILLFSSLLLFRLFVLHFAVQFTPLLNTFTCFFLQTKHIILHMVTTNLQPLISFITYCYTYFYQLLVYLLQHPLQT